MLRRLTASASAGTLDFSGSGSGSACDVIDLDSDSDGADTGKVPTKSAVAVSNDTTSTSIFSAITTFFTGGSNSGSGSGSSTDREAQYVASLAPMRFETIDLLGAIRRGIASHTVLSSTVGTSSSSFSSSSSSAKHAAASKTKVSESERVVDSFLASSRGGGGGGGGRKGVLHILKELSTFVTCLPVEWGSAIFVKSDEDRPDVLKALVIGPQDSPYQNGCFEFDILLPAQYPAVPPSVLLATTGGGSVRFNPNLYNSGKVCLSLLGTWAGPGWDPHTSTLLQVLVSIQSLIFVSDPFFNEPGFEGLEGSAKGVAASKKYNSSLRAATVQWAMLDHLRRLAGGPTVTSPSVFGDIIRTHFRLKRDEVIAQLHSWSKDGEIQSTAVSFSAGGAPAAPLNWTRLTQEMITLLNAL